MQMTKSLTENTWVYTDKGIENVHWCNVNGVDELVTPKGEVLAPVPDYQTWKNVREQWKVAIPQIEKLQEQLKEANEVIKKYMAVAFEIRSEEEKPTVLQLAFGYLEKWGVK